MPSPGTPSPGTPRGRRCMWRPARRRSQPSLAGGVCGDLLGEGLNPPLAGGVCGDLLGEGLDPPLACPPMACPPLARRPLARREAGGVCGDLLGEGLNPPLAGSVCGDLLGEGLDPPLARRSMARRPLARREAGGVCGDLLRQGPQPPPFTLVSLSYRNKDSPVRVRRRDDRRGQEHSATMKSRIPLGDPSRAHLSNKKANKTYMVTLSPSPLPYLLPVDGPD